MADTARDEQGREIERTERERIGQSSQPTHVDLFSGIGGFALAAQWAGFRTIAFCEIDPYCQKILAKNFLADTSSNGFNRRKVKGRSDSTDANGTKGTDSCGVPQGRNGSRVERPRLHANIFDFDGTVYRGCDLLTGGFPCQPFSVAGKRRGAADDRAIWPEMFRVISEARPAWVLGENVPGIIPMELDNVLSDLEGIGYACRPFVIPACAVDARHRRDRLWIVGRRMGDAPVQGLQNGRGTSVEEHGGAQPQSKRSSCGIGGIQNLADTFGGVQQSESRGSDGRSSAVDGSAIESGRRSFLADSECIRQQGQGKLIHAIDPAQTSNGKTTESWNGSGPAIWLPEPNVGRVAHGIPKRVDRLKGLGNAIVPQVAYEILREIRRMI